jgi:hypothetical protein
MDLHMCLKPVSPGCYFWWSWGWCIPRQRCSDARNPGRVTEITYIPEVNWQRCRVCQSIRRDVRDIVHIDCQFAQVSPVTSVVPVGPDGNVFETSILTESSAKANRPLDSNRGHYAVEVIVEAEADEC